MNVRPLLFGLLYRMTIMKMIKTLKLQHVWPGDKYWTFQTAAALAACSPVLGCVLCLLRVSYVVRCGGTCVFRDCGGNIILLHV